MLYSVVYSHCRTLYLFVILQYTSMLLEQYWHVNIHVVSMDFPQNWISNFHVELRKLWRLFLNSFFLGFCCVSSYNRFWPCFRGTLIKEAPRGLIKSILPSTPVNIYNIVQYDMNVLQKKTNVLTACGAKTFLWFESCTFSNNFSLNLTCWDWYRF